MLTLDVRIEPAEPILFGDNRSARAGEGHAVADQDPSPATIYGAIGGRIAHRLGARGERHWAPAAGVLGPFARELDRPSAPGSRAELLGYAPCDAEGTPWLPKPLHLLIEKTGGEARSARGLLLPNLSARLTSSSLPPGWCPLRGEQDLEQEDEEPLLIDEDLLGDVLSGAAGLDGSLGVSVRPERSLDAAEPRLGLTMANASNTAASGRLFARPYRRFHREVLSGNRGWAGAGFTAWYRILGDQDPGVSSWNGLGFLGGDRRRADFRFSIAGSNPLSMARDRVCERAAESCGWLAYLLTPLPVPENGVTLDGCAPIAGAVGRTRYVSGWASAAVEPGPRRLLALLPAGSVFFFEWRDDQQDPELRRAWLQERWLAPLDPKYAAAGFGRVLTGVWP
ncbi:MAG TPA: type III-B CRISPR module-associated Cmr3 family protein [Thermoanaerobaculia bacterium]|jgi:CRISPR type III-B/RAMP module-associated protein Cmr3